ERARAVRGSLTIKPAMRVETVSPPVSAFGGCDGEAAHDGGGRRRAWRHDRRRLPAWRAPRDRLCPGLQWPSSPLAAEVHARLSDATVRCISPASVTGVRRGLSVLATGGFISVAVGEATLSR